ncbi:MAG: class I SAM-dependent RNA methyltransferase, partial [Anaerolineaceae bacterium]|nr:class I SAM-dependent RNA methyltransferase [Anaerolineaceae bacterium]
ISVKIEKPVYGGEFLARLPDHRPVFVPFVLPDEIAMVQVTQDKKGYARASLINVVEPSKKRIYPPCKYFSQCGGCHYQHMDYDDQLKLKHQVVLEQFSRVPGFNEQILKNIVASPNQLHYRNNVQFSINENGKLGFQAFGSNQIVPIDECLLAGDQIIQSWKMLDLEQFPGLKRIHIREGLQEEIMLILESDNFLEIPSLELDVPVSVVHLSEVGKIVMAGEDHLIYQVKDQFFHVSAESFFQVNTTQAEKMIDLVCEYLPIKGKTFLELYCGVGLFTRFLADRYELIYAVEESTSACNDFAINMDEYDHINLYMGSVKEIVPHLEIQPESILLDPPRSGIDPSTLESILAFKAPKIVYVSCDVSTLSRDLRRLLEGGYQLVDITPFDMFPQTFHIECVALLTLNVE